MLAQACKDFTGHKGPKLIDGTPMNISPFAVGARKNTPAIRHAGQISAKKLGFFPPHHVNILRGLIHHTPHKIDMGMTLPRDSYQCVSQLQAAGRCR